LGIRRVVGLGLCVVDHLYVVDSFEFEESRIRTSERLESTGGMTGNALVQAARLRCNAHLLSVLGDDPTGRGLRRAVGRLGVKTGRVVLSASSKTTVAVVLVHRYSGERRLVVPDRRSLERSAPPLDLAPIERRTLLLLDGHYPTQALRAAKRARQVGATVVGDFSRPGPASEKLLPWVDYPIVPQEFAEAYAGESAAVALRQLRDRFGGHPVVTQGAAGGIYLEGDRVRRYRAKPVRVRDTTGAGDAFHGAFAAGLYHGLDFEESIDLAARAAAVCCTALGATTRLLDREQAGL